MTWKQCAFEGCEADMKVAGYCSRCYKRLWYNGEVGRSLLPYEPLKIALAVIVANNGGSYSSVDKMCGLAQGQTRKLLLKNKRIHIKTADLICLKLGLPFDALFNREVA